MTSHDRKHSRGSAFSFRDAVRSLSRVGSRQGSSAQFIYYPNRLPDFAAIRVDGEQHAVQLLGVSGLSPSSATEVFQVVSSTGCLEPHAEIPHHVHRTRLTRPLSWLSDTRSRSRKKRVDRSISAPVLKSTTNPDVAGAEDVRCGEQAQSDIIQSTWSPGLGWIPDHSEHPQLIDFVETFDENSHWLRGHELQARKRQLPRNTTLTRLKGAIISRLKMHRRPAIPEEVQFSRLEDRTMSPVDGGLARRKAEGISLCKQKIRNLTGHGNVKRKPIENFGQPLQHPENIEVHHEYQPLLFAGSPQWGSTPDVPADLSGDFTISNLEQSFINAVNKLDLQDPPQTALDPPATSKMAPFTRHSLFPGLRKKASKEITNIAGIQTSQSVPCSYSVGQASLIPVPTDKQRLRVNPLRCHPDVNGFAERPTDTPKTTPVGVSTPRIGIAREGLEDLENAPIYSPSMGHLSQYSRLTPSPARSTASSFQTASLLRPSNWHGMSHGTPTPQRNIKAASQRYVLSQTLKRTRASPSDEDVLQKHGQATVDGRSDVIHKYCEEMMTEKKEVAKATGRGVTDESKRVTKIGGKEVEEHTSDVFGVPKKDTGTNETTIPTPTLSPREMLPKPAKISIRGGGRFQPKSFQEWKKAKEEEEFEVFKNTGQLKDLSPRRVAGSRRVCEWVAPDS